MLVMQITCVHFKLPCMFNGFNKSLWKGNGNGTESFQCKWLKQVIADIGPVKCDGTATSGIRGWLQTKQSASLYFPDAPTSEHFLLALKAIIVFKQFRYCVIRDQRRW